MDGTVAIRKACSRADYDACVALQREVWGLADLEVTSALQLIATVHAGGLLLLAERGVAVIRGVVQVPEAYITIERLMARAYNSKTINAVRGFSSGHYLGGANDNYVFSTDANARVFEMWDFSGCL